MEPLVQLAIALAARLLEAFPTVTYCGEDYTVSSVWEPEVSVAQEQPRLNTPNIWVVDFGEDLGADHFVGSEEFTLLIVLQQKLGQANRVDQIQALGQLAASIGRYCRPIDPEDAWVLVTADVAATCTRVKRQPARNLEDSRKGLFYTELLTTWRHA